MMGWWKLDAWKGKGKKEKELTDVDREHIADEIRKGYSQGELNDE